MAKCVINSREYTSIFSCKLNAILLFYNDHGYKMLFMCVSNRDRFAYSTSDCVSITNYVCYCTFDCWRPAYQGSGDSTGFPGYMHMFKKVKTLPSIRLGNGQVESSVLIILKVNVIVDTWSPSMSYLHQHSEGLLCGKSIYADPNFMFDKFDHTLHRA